MQYAKKKVIQKKVDIVGDLLSSDELSDVPSDLFEANHEYMVEIPLEIRYSTKSGKAYGSA